MSSTPQPTLEADGPATDAALSESAWRTSDPPGLGRVLARLVAFPRTILQHQDLVRSSVRRELEARFTGTLLGWLWPLVFPIFTFAVYYFIFAELLQVKFGERIADNPELKAAMGVYMFVGIVVWTGFAEGVNRSTTVITENGNLIKKLAFPTELLPLNQVLSNLVTMMFGIVAFMLTVFATNAVFDVGLWPNPPLAPLLWIPALVVLQGLFTYGLGLFLATLHVFVRDTAQVIGILITVWMFITPLFWAPELLPPEEVAKYIDALQVNPMYHLVFVWRNVLMGGIPAEAFVEGDAVGHSVLLFSAWAIGVFVVGYIFFALSQRRFADEV
ncbi:MAG: ABC transporter permease [Planctomycetota bacterium]